MTTDELIKVENLGETFINLTVIVSPKHGTLCIKSNDHVVRTVGRSRKTLTNILWNAKCITHNGKTYIRSIEKNDRWQTKEAIDASAEGMENNYASWSDDDVMEKFDSFTIEQMR